MELTVKLLRVLVLLTLVTKSSLAVTCNYQFKPEPQASDFVEIKNPSSTKFASLSIEFQEQLIKKFNNTSVADIVERMTTENGFYPYHINTFKESSSEMELWGIILLDDSYVTNAGNIFKVKHETVLGLLDNLKYLRDSSLGKTAKAVEIYNRLLHISTLKIFTAIHIWDEPRIPLTYWHDFIITANRGDILKIGEVLKNYNPNQPYLYAASEILNPNIFDIDARDARGNTALMMATAQGKTDTAKVLIDKCAHPGYTNFDGKTALDLAKENGNDELVEILEQITP